MALKKTEGKCRPCGGDIVEKIVREHDPASGSMLVGPGSADQIVEVSKGFHCKKCGLKYEFVPSVSRRGSVPAPSQARSGEGSIKGSSFAELRRAAPAIHVSKPADEWNGSGVTTLVQRDHDAQYEGHRYSDGYLEGSGSRKNPYRYRSAAPVSPHYVIVDLWSRFRTRSVFIMVNDWLLRTSPDGVTAADGHFTKLA